MKKLKEITKEEFEYFLESKDQVSAFMKILDMEKADKYSIGDTVIRVDNAKEYEVYKNTMGIKNIYYLVTNKIDEKLASAYSFYPRFI